MGTYIIDMISDKATISQIFSALVAALVAALILYLVKKSTNLLNTTDIAYSRVNLCKIRKKIDEKTYSATFISYFMKNEGKKIARNIQILIDVEPQNISINPEISFTTRKNPDGKFVIIIPHIDGGDSIILNFSEMISSSVVSSLLLFEIRKIGRAHV